MGNKYIISFDQPGSVNPYSGKSKEELLEMYQPKVWETLEDHEKMSLLEATGKIYSDEKGVQNAPFFEQELNDGLYGGYNGGTNTVTVNLKNCDNPFEALDTVAHEVTHAYQAESIQKVSGSYTEKELALLKAENGWAYESSGLAYDRQTLEQDSNNAGIRYVLALKERFQGNASFQDYLHTREEHFQKNVEDYLNNYHENCLSEMRQVEKAYRYGEITDEERTQALSCIIDRENSVKADMLNLQEEIQKAHHETAVNKECQADLKRMAKDQHELFQSKLNQQNLDKRELQSLQEKNDKALRNLNYTKEALGKEYHQKYDQLRQYVTENNLTKERCQSDEKYQAYSRELSDLKNQQESCHYHISQLNTDNEMIQQNCAETGQSAGVQSSSPSSSQSSNEESAGVEMA